MFTACETEAPIDNGYLHKRIKADGQGGLVENDKNFYYLNDPNDPNSKILVVGAPQTAEILGTTAQQKTLSAKIGANRVPFLKYNRSMVAVLANPKAVAATSTKQTSGLLWYRVWIPSYDPAVPGIWSSWGQSNTAPDADNSAAHPMYSTQLRPKKWKLVQSPNDQTVSVQATLDDGSTQIWTGKWSPDSSGRGSISWTESNSK
jgi:hypothetical protein